MGGAAFRRYSHFPDLKTLVTCLFAFIVVCLVAISPQCSEG